MTRPAEGYPSCFPRFVVAVGVLGLLAQVALVVWWR